MAIKEFIIGPQNYWEEGYFDGDYTLPNVAKFYLQCDIDNVKGGRVVTGEYFLDNYIDGTYWHKNAIEAGLTATADKIKNAQVQATGYFVEGYYATGYVEQGIASVLNVTAGVLVGTTASISAQTSTSTQAGKQVDSQTAMAVVFSQTAIGGRTSDIDLYAFSQGGLTSDVNAIRAYELDALSSFNIATDYIRQRTANSDAAAEFTQSIAFERNRDNASATQVAFSFSINETLFKAFDSTLQTQSSINTQVSIFRDVGATIVSDSQVSCVISHIEGADIQASNFASVSATAERTRDNDSQSSIVSATDVTAVKTTETTANTQSTFSSNVVNDRTRDNDSQSSIVLALTADVVATKVSVSSIQNQFSVSCVISHIHGADIQAFNNAQTSLVPSITRDYQSAQTSLVSISAGADRTRDNDSQFNVSATVSATALRIQPGEVATSLVFSSSSVAVKSVEANASYQVNVSTQTQNDRLRESVIPTAVIEFQTNVIGNAVRGIQENFTAQTNVSAIIGTLESITLVVFNFASVNALPFINAEAASEISSNSSTNVSAVKTTECISSIASPFNDISVAGERIRYQDSSINVSTLVVADNSRTRDNDSQIQSTAAVSAIIGKLEDIDLYAFSNNSLITDAVVIRDAVSNCQIEFTSTTNAGKIPPIDSAISSSISLSADNIRVRFADSTLSASGGVLSVVDVIPGVQVNMTGSFTTNRPYVENGYVDDDYATNFETVANYIVDNLHQLLVVSSMSIDAEYSVQGAALVASAGTMTIDAVKTTVTSSSQTSTASVNADIEKLVGFEISVQTSFSIEAKVGSQEDIFGTFFNDVSLTADIRKLVDAESNNSIVSTFYANTENSLTTQGESNVAAEFTATSTAEKTASVSADIQALAFTVSLGSAIIVEQANISSTFVFIVDVNVVRSGVASTQSTASTTAQISVTRNAVVSISGAMTFVSELREIRLDEIEYRIPAEGWEYRIVGENREYDIIGETRLRSITGETRERRIDGETRIYNLD